MSTQSDELDNELFELCKEVYKLLPKWDNTDFGWCEHELDGNIILPYHTDSENYRNWFICPLYTSDYLLEKLPIGVQLRKDSEEYGAYRPPQYGSPENVFNSKTDPILKGRIRWNADTPLKALLRLTLALKEAELKARLNELGQLPNSEIGKLANHSLKVDIHVEDRIKLVEAALQALQGDKK